MPFDQSMPPREAPANLQAEQALLGALLANNRAFERVGSFLRPEHFADPAHGPIYAAIARRIESGRLADAVTLRGEFEHSELLADLGGPGYFAQLLTAMVGILPAGDYGRAIHDAWVRRELIELGQAMVAAAYGGTEAAGAQQIGDAVAALSALGESAGSGVDRMGSLGDAMAAVLDAPASATGSETGAIYTGLESLDRLWRGLWPGTLDILGGRPGAGKTALALQIAAHVARESVQQDPRRPASVDFWSLEMPAAQLAARALADACGVSTDDLREGRLTTLQAERAVLARREWAGIPLVIHDRPRQTVAEVCFAARVARRRSGCRLVIVDHAARFVREKGQARLDEVGFLNHVAGAMHDLAQELNVPVLLLWHLGRDGEREARRPRLADLKYAGEGDADNVVMLWRPSDAVGPAPDAGNYRRGGANLYEAALLAHEAARKAAEGRVEAVFAKRRNGRTGFVSLEFDGPRMRFSDIEGSGAPAETVDLGDLWGEG